MRELRPCYGPAQDMSLYSPRVGGWKGGISHVRRPFLFATRKASFRYGGRDKRAASVSGEKGPRTVDTRGGPAYME